MQEVTLFIPRVLTTVSKKQITDHLIKEKIGYCSNIKAKFRINENGFKYWFAFITIQFFDTENARKFYKKVVEEEKIISMEYFDEVLQKHRHWDISLRNLEKKTNKKELEDGEISESSFGEEECKEIYEEYLILEKEIQMYGYNFGMAC